MEAEIDWKLQSNSSSAASNWRNALVKRILNQNSQAFVLFITLFLSSCGQASDRKLLGEIIKLAENGNSAAQYNAGMMFNNGIGTEKDPRKAFGWFQKASDAGDALGSYKVGCYFSGQFKDVVPTDVTKELHYKLIAATAGYSLAQYDLGIIYCKRDQFKEGIYWWELAAHQGYPMALYNLSVIYNDGKVWPKDKVLSYAYFKLAKLRGDGRVNPNAQKALDEVKSTMSSAEVEKAEQIVSSWEVKPTAITLRASEGIAEAKKLVNSGAR